MKERRSFTGLESDESYETKNPQADIHLIDMPHVLRTCFKWESNIYIIEYILKLKPWRRSWNMEQDYQQP